MDRCYGNRLPDLRADTGSEVLANCQANAEQHMQRHRPAGGSAAAAATTAAGSGQAGPARVLVRQLDWLDPPDWLLEQPENAGRHSGSSEANGGGAHLPTKQQERPQPDVAGVDRFAWRPEDVAALQQLDYLLAADSVYDDVLTEAFMRRCGTEHHAFWLMACFLQPLAAGLASGGNACPLRVPHF